MFHFDPRIFAYSADGDSLWVSRIPDYHQARIEEGTTPTGRPSITFFDDPPHDMAASIEQVVAGLTSAGAVGAIGNRRALRIGQEPIDLFRRYVSLYAREQAFCHFSPALIANLERNWDAQNRKA